MSRIIVLMTFLLSSPLWAAEFLEFNSQDGLDEFKNESNWVLNAGFEYISFPVNVPDYNGTHKKYESGSSEDLYGAGLGFGRDFYLGNSFSSTLKLNSFYHKTFQGTTGKAAEDIDLDLAKAREDSMVYGGDVSLSVNYLFENKVLNVQPFIEVGLGTGVSQMEREYEFRGSEVGGSDESYNARVREGFNYLRTSAGLNFISGGGIISYLKVTQMDLQFTQRKVNTNVDGVSGKQKLKNKDIDNENTQALAASLGLGWMF